MKATELMIGYKWVVGYENLYAVSDKGEVYSFRSHKILKPHSNHRGYLWETREKISAANRGKKMTKEQRLQLSVSKKGKYTGGDNPFAKRVKQIDRQGNVIKLWDSISEASRELKLSVTSISNCLKGLSKTAGGFIWLYQ